MQNMLPLKTMEPQEFDQQLTDACWSCFVCRFSSLIGTPLTGGLSVAVILADTDDEKKESNKVHVTCIHMKNIPLRFLMFQCVTADPS